ncbi:ribosome biogenesis GTPase Der [Candidatus Bandiella euplotis]|uniref:GTPase Der n=1 Tax=Candidatus Bandiella euplotis TaxID=1664265 RepID=A0ABZ0UKV4_9RICK|nr:ribosome biogenesis GTPase Der [Candidatus Bandiella woodruffii]WPX96349.1 GTPase Der [Candidatus Bandiella woodruffii]
MFKIAIIGRENVGKSTIFNKLCQKDVSIVNDSPGVTRDYITHVGKLFDLEFELVDTAGWYLGKDKNNLNVQIKNNTMAAINEVDLIFFVVDVRTYLSDEDVFFAKKIRKLNKKTILLANKAESKRVLTQDELLRLGFGEAIFIAAEHKMGFNDIYQVISPMMEQKLQIQEAKDDDNLEDRPNERQISISIIGRPNVGKSTLFNEILGFERSLVSDMAGTTRDHVIYEIEMLDNKINLIDTAGVRRKGKVYEEIEELSVKKAMSAIRISDVVLLVMDSQAALEKQDLILANLALKQNKLLIPIINKQDLINNFAEFKDEISYLIKKKLPQIKDVKVLYTSAQKNFNPKLLFEWIIKLWQLYQTKIPTSKLNDWLSKTLATYSMPIVKNNTKLKVKYVKQSSIAPPTFLFFINIATQLTVNKNFEIFLTNSLRKEFGLYGIPIQINFILNKNPFA